MASEKKIIVSSDRALGQRRIALVLKPEPNVHDVDLLKRQFLERAISTGVISHFGGSTSTTVEDLVVERFDEEWGCELLVGPFEHLNDKEKGIIIKIQPGSTGVIATNSVACAQASSQSHLPPYLGDTGITRASSRSQSPSRLEAGSKNMTVPSTFSVSSSPLMPNASSSVPISVLDSITTGQDSSVSNEDVNKCSSLIDMAVDDSSRSSSEQPTALPESPLASVHLNSRKGVPLNESTTPTCSNPQAMRATPSPVTPLEGRCGSNFASGAKKKSSKRSLTYQSSPSLSIEGSPKTVTFRKTDATVPSDSDNDSAIGEVQITLPSLSAQLVAANEAGQLREKVNEFVKLAGAHLIIIAPERNRTIYDSYCCEIVKKYPVFADRTFRGKSNWKLTKHLANIRGYDRNKEQRKQRRETMRQSNSSRVNTPGASTSISEDHDAMIEDSLDGFGGGQTEKQEMEEFNNRRSLVKGQKLAEILKLVPKYRDIQAVHDDFLKMEPMASIGEQEFGLRFEKLATSFRRFLQLEEASNPRKVLETCIEINRRSSTAQGVKGVPDLITLKPAGEKVTPMPVLAMPHCVVILDGDDLCGMLLCCCKDLVFKIDNVDHVWEIFMLLLGCYYVYDLQYFAAFGLLSVLDKFVLQIDCATQPAPAKKGRKGKSLPPTRLAKFLDDFEKFLASDAGN